MSIKENVEKILQNIERIKKENNINREIKLVAISKTYPAEYVLEAVEAEHFDFGENRVQEGTEKIDEINDERITWHLVGHLQSNKASKAARYFDVIHSVGRKKIAREINKFAGQYGKNPEIFVQVNTTGEDSKYGCEPQDTEEICSYIINECSNIKLVGLMTIGPLYGGAAETRECFHNLYGLRRKLADKFGDEYMSKLSMGMSADYEIAIQEGATHLRIGSAIFGKRT